MIHLCWWVVVVVLRSFHLKSSKSNETGIIAIAGLDAAKLQIERNSCGQLHSSSPGTAFPNVFCRFSFASFILYFYEKSHAFSASTVLWWELIYGTIGSFLAVATVMMKGRIKFISQNVDWYSSGYCLPRIV